MARMLTILFFMFTSFMISHAATTNPSLIITSQSISKNFTRSMLLSFPIYHINISNSRAYLHLPMSYQAVKLCDLLHNFHVLPSDTIEFISADKFTATLPANIVMNCSDQNAIAYIAIEPEKHPWPKFKYNNPNTSPPDEGTAGPFAVIWTHPEKSYISNEYWAWKLKRIEVHHKLDASNYLQPPKTNNRHLRNGYYAYISRCSGCHTMNKIGKAVIGPDLNIPKNATKYYASDKQFKQFIRNPQSVRVRANDRMSGTDEKFLSEREYIKMT